MLVICLLLSACAPAATAPDTTTSAVTTSPSSSSEQLEAPVNPPSEKQDALQPEEGTYNEGVVLVKYDGEMNENVLSQIAVKSATPLYTGSTWYTLELNEGADTAEAVTYLRQLGAFEQVDFDYIMKNAADVVDVTSNPEYSEGSYFTSQGITGGWEYLAENEKQPGGSSDVVIAVIDTGVDYTHLDLRNNIWLNPGEIPDNGIDDDGNGYVDDVYGWNCVGDNNDPMDDNGHGTHVAGIIAAENNDIGSVGIAYNCKIMVLKAGNSSGYFNNSDIAEAIQYAYMNGASVINMSFGGSMLSIAVEDALENAYNSCVLVAAAGNDSCCNHLRCPACENKGVSYPAALPYVIGVMSTNADGSTVSGFSNYDHYPYNEIEYEVCAVGENIRSTWPGNKYATLSGTSMAAPVVSAVAALLRSAYPDRETYATKYLQSQIVNTGDLNPIGGALTANLYNALTKLPTPEVNLYDYRIDDSTSINAANNGNGVIDAGETVRLYLSLQNRGGVASNVQVTMDTMRDNDPSLTDPYFTLVNSSITLSDIGTYSVRESGDKYFEIQVSGDCPNDYLADFNIRFTYQNGMNEEDTTLYSGDGTATFNISRGYHLYGIVTEDTVFENDRLYIIGEDWIIPEGVTVTFKEGCEIQFYDDREYYNSPVVTVYGTLNIEGTKDNMVKIGPNNQHLKFYCSIKVKDTGTVRINYANAINIRVYEIYAFNSGDETASFTSASTTIKNSYLHEQYDPHNLHVWNYVNGKIKATSCHMVLDELDSSHIDLIFINCDYRINSVRNSSLICAASSYFSTHGDISVFENNTFISKAIRGYDSLENPITFARSGNVINNSFMIGSNNIGDMRRFNFNNSTVENNRFSPLYQQYASQVIQNYYDASGNPTVDVYGSCSDISKLWPYVVSVEMFDKDGNPITTVGKEEIKVRVTFNRPMDKTQNTSVTFGTREPYADYKIEGSYVSDTVWEGTYTLKAQIENGQNYLKVNNACAAEDPTKTVFGEYHLHEFTIDTTAAMSMNLLANPTAAGIELTWAQDDYDTLLGYNIYRSEEKNGNYVKLNPAILLSTDDKFVDENAEPGKNYWYTYTVVLSDFSESNPAGKVMATAKDTMEPSIYHTPVNQGYLNNNLVISCTATDNVAVSNVTLYYRTKGASSWKTLTMSKQNDKFSATIFGSELSAEGLEYYIAASDSVNTVYKGSATLPYNVIIKDASAISRIGDVDGDGTVTTKDALMLMQSINGDLILTDDQFKRADLNGDNVLNSMEALRILQYINGNVASLEM